MTIRRKLIAGYAALVAIPAFVGLVSLVINERTQRDAIELAEHAYAEVRSAHALSSAVATVEAQLWQLVVARDQQSAMGFSAPDGSLLAARAALDTALVAMHEAVATAKEPTVFRAQRDARTAADEASELTVLARLEASTTQLARHTRQIDATIETTPIAGVQQAVGGLLTEISRDILPDVDRVMEHAEAEMAVTAAALVTTTNLARRLDLGAVLIALLVALVIGTLTARSILRPIAILRDAAERMGRGVLEEPVALPSRDEMAVLGDVMYRTMRDLHGTMARLTDALAERDRMQTTLQEFNASLEKTVHERTMQLQQLIDVAPFGAVVYRLFPDQRLVIVSANRSADRMLKVDTRQFIGKTIEEAFPALATSTLPDLCRRVARISVTHHVGPVSYYENGINGLFEVDLVPLGPNRMVVFFRDVTNLIEAYDETLVGWSRAMDIRDRETEGHTQRVTETAVTLGRTMGVAEADLVHLRWGALLHDIGKIGVPDSILYKPGPLTREEWVVMRKHPEIAREMLAPIAFLRPALSIPYCHHEKWNGTGYPRGLCGEQIPLAARIFAVADVWDALRNERPYHAAWTAEKARAYVLEQSGKHFDPAVVDAFERMLATLDVEGKVDT